MGSFSLIYYLQSAKHRNCVQELFIHFSFSERRLQDDAPKRLSVHGPQLSLRISLDGCSPKIERMLINFLLPSTCISLNLTKCIHPLTLACCIAAPVHRNCRFPHRCGCASCLHRQKLWTCRWKYGEKIGVNNYFNGTDSTLICIWLPVPRSPPLTHHHHHEYHQQPSNRTTRIRKNIKIKKIVS